MKHDWKGQHVSIPKEFEPYAVLETDSKTKNGYYQIDRTLYNENKQMSKHIHSGHHGRPSKHPYGEDGEHKHVYTSYKPDRTSEELNEEDRNQNKDIIMRGEK